jgi:hypothetical protein
MEIETLAKPQVFEVKAAKLSLVNRDYALAKTSCFVTKNVMFISPKNGH